MLELHNLNHSIKRLADIDRGVRSPEHLEAVGSHLVDEMRSRVRVDDGDLRDSLEYRVTTDGSSLSVGANRNGWYWHFVEFGTEPHPIAAREWNNSTARRGKKVLADVVAGIVYGVRLPRGHPGARPYPFIRPTLDEARGTMTSTLTGSLKKAAQVGGD